MSTPFAGDPESPSATESVPPPAGPGRAVIWLGTPSAPPQFEARFQSISELARGGQGRVLVALDSVLHREVALKELLRADLPSAVRRFEREALLTARLQHPGIVSVYELARRSSGEPVLVMRRVQGKPFDRAIADAGTYEKRLALLTPFTAACDAIAYAHQQGVIHRDIKPSNVLLGDFGDTVVIDWGIAKEIGAAPGDEEDAEAPAPDEGLTGAGEVIGTPAFMSPEQSRGEPVDARSDVYALGAMLYQLLAGRPAYQGKNSKEVLQAVRTGPPVPVASLVPGLAPELASMVARAMAPARTDRYASAGELAEELKRFQTGRLVHSHSYSTWQLVRRWAGRHAAQLVLTGAFLALLAVGGVVSVRRIVAERERANREAAASKRVSEFMTSMFKVSSPGEARGNSVTAREILDAAAREIESGLTEDPEVRARLMKSMGTVYSNLGLFPQAQALLEKAAETLATQLGPDNAETLAARTEVTILLRRLRKWPEAEKVAADVFARSRRALGPDHEVSLEAANQLGIIVRRRGRSAEAESIFREALDRTRRKLGKEHPVALQLMSNLSSAVKDLGRVDEAEALLLEAIEIEKRHQGPDHPDTLGLLNNLGTAYYTQHRLDEALSIFQRLAETERRVYGPEHPERGLVLNNMATILFDQKRYAEAEPVVRELLLALEHRMGLDNPDTLGAKDNLGNLLLHMGRLDEAEKVLAPALEGIRRLKGQGRTTLAEALSVNAWLAAQRGQKDAALALLREAAAQTRNPDQVTLLEDPLLQPLRGDPRFEALLAAARKASPAK